MRDANGRISTSRTSFAFVLFVFTIKIALAEIVVTSGGESWITFPSVDYTGLSTFLGVVAGIYGYRSHTKAQEGNTTNVS